MAGIMENTEQTAEDVLLEDVMNALDITFEDPATGRKIRDIMRQGKARLEKLKGGAIDFAEEQEARMLLFSFCRYGRSNALEQFEHDFKCQLTGFALDAAIENMKEVAEDETEI